MRPREGCNEPHVPVRDRQKTPMPKHLAAVGAALLLAAASVQPQEPWSPSQTWESALDLGAPIGGSAEERLARLERILSNQSGSDLVLQLQQVQQEVQELRGLIETLSFEVGQLRSSQRDQFLDLDARLGGADTPAAPAPLSTPATGKPRVSAPRPFSPGAIGIPALPQPETPGGSESDAYRDAFELLKERRYGEAANAFHQVLSRFPQGQHTDNARYWLGETYYVQRNYPAALAEFDRLVQLSPDSSKVPGAMLKIGYIQYDQEAWEYARAAFTELAARYPESPEGRLARSRLERMDREGR